MIRPFNPLTYFHYLFSNAEARETKVFSLLRADDFCAHILDDLEAYGYEVSYSVFGSSGEYKSYSLSIGGDNYEAEFLKRHAQGEFKARFSMSPRYGLGQNAFYFIHELIHFQQDLHGALQSRDVLENECEAAVESIKAAHRIGGVVWEGALSSLDWRRLARGYGQDQNAEKLAERWHASTQKRYYAGKEKAEKENLSPPYLWKQLKL